MFLQKRKRTRRGFLLKRFFIDIWGYYLKKKKFKNKKTKKFLEFFIRYLKHWIKPTRSYEKKLVKFLKKRKRKRHNFKKNAYKKKSKATITPLLLKKISPRIQKPPYEKKKKGNHSVLGRVWFEEMVKKSPNQLASRRLSTPIKKNRRKKWGLRVKKNRRKKWGLRVKKNRRRRKKSKKISNPYKSFITQCLMSLIKVRIKIKAEPSWVKFWNWKINNRAAAIMQSKYWRGKRVPFFKYTYLRRPKDYIITKLIDIIFQQHHYGFSTLTSFRMYIRKFTSKTTNWKAPALGLEGMLANQLCKTTLIPEIRTAYILIRSGAVLVNNRTTKNPRKMLYVGDTIKIAPNYRKVIAIYYISWLKRRKIIAGVRLYFDINLSLLAYKIWRAPDSHEKRFICYYPFMKTVLDWGKVSMANFKI